MAKYTAEGRSHWCLGLWVSRNLIIGAGNVALLRTKRPIKPNLTAAYRTDSALLALCPDLNPEDS